MTIPTHDFCPSKNPEVPDSGFLLDSQTDKNQALNQDFRIQRILPWILWILNAFPVSMRVCRLFPESKCSPYYYVVGNPKGFPTLRRGVPLRRAV